MTISTLCFSYFDNFTFVYSSFIALTQEFASFRHKIKKNKSLKWLRVADKH